MWTNTARPSRSGTNLRVGAYIAWGDDDVQLEPDGHGERSSHRCAPVLGREGMTASESWCSVVGREEDHTWVRL